MPRYLSGVVVGFLLGLLSARPLQLAHSAVQLPAMERPAFQPAILSPEVQEVGQPAAKTAEWAISAFVFQKVRTGDLQLAAAANYVDVLAAVEVMADYWLRRHGRQPRRENYIAILCMLSFGVGCPPKPAENRATALAVRERLVDRAFFDERRRDGLRRRLRALSPEQVVPAEIVRIPLSEVIDLTGLR